MQYELTGSQMSWGQVFLYLIFLQGLHHQCVILPELSKQLDPGRGPSEQDLTWNNFKESKKTDVAVNVNLKQRQQV